VSKPLLLVHAGAGSVPLSSFPQHLEGCVAAVEEGCGEFVNGAVNAACAAVCVLEKNPLYNSATGCALTLKGGVSLDAAVMEGSTRNAGGVCALGAFRNPVLIAKKLLPEPTILLAGGGADEWAREHGFEMISEGELITEAAAEQWKKVVKEGTPSNWAGGTVGAVARDADGNLAAATSTGGTMGKLPGRVGDSPLIGVGTYADDVCAISATGEGEAFMRASFAARLADAIGHGGDPQEELEKSLARVKKNYGGIGGAILITRDGGPFMAWTTERMAHAHS